MLGMHWKKQRDELQPEAMYQRGQDSGSQVEQCLNYEPMIFNSQFNKLSNLFESNVCTGRSGSKI